MLGLEYRFSPKLMWITNVSYGETWLLLENRPRKEQLVYGFRWVPMAGQRRGIFSNLAIDLIALYVRFPDADEESRFPLPIFPVLTWQW